MKQKKLNDILYVFDITPYVITQDTDADVIKVQQECYEGYVELNPDLASKIVKYNYHMFTVTQQEWAPYVDADDKPSPELAWSADSATVTIGADDNIFPTLSNPHSVTVTYTSSDTGKATIDASTGSITLVAEGNTTISAVFAGNDDYAAQTVTYTLTVQQAQPQPLPSPELAWSEESATVTIGESNSFPTLSNPHSVTVSYESSDITKATIDASTGLITLVAEGNTTISASFAGDSELAPQTVSYALTVQQDQPSVGHTLTLEGASIHDHVTVKFDNVTVQTDYQYFNVAENTVIDIYPTDNVANYDLNSGATWDTDHWTATMPDSDLTISISYVLPQENQGVTVTYNVNNTSQAVTIWTGDNGNEPDQMFVDGVRQTVADTYQFSTTGSHTIQYIFYDNVLDIVFHMEDQTAPIEITGFQVGSNIEEVTGDAWTVKTFNTGESGMIDVEQTYLPITPPTIIGMGSSTDRPQATIYVPSDSVSAYQAASVWSNISESIQAIPVQ